MKAQSHGLSMRITEARMFQVDRPEHGYSADCCIGATCNMRAYPSTDVRKRIEFPSNVLQGQLDLV